MIVYTIVSRISAHGRLNVTCNLARMGAYPGCKLHRSCYIDPLTCSTWALTQDTLVYNTIAMVSQMVNPSPLVLFLPLSPSPPPPPLSPSLPLIIDVNQLSPE